MDRKEESKNPSVAMDRTLSDEPSENVDTKQNENIRGKQEVQGAIKKQLQQQEKDQRVPLGDIKVVYLQQQSQQQYVTPNKEEDKVTQFNPSNQSYMGFQLQGIDGRSRNDNTVSTQYITPDKLINQHPPLIMPNAGSYWANLNKIPQIKTLPPWTVPPNKEGRFGLENINSGNLIDPKQYQRAISEQVANIENACIGIGGSSTRHLSFLPIQSKIALQNSQQHNLQKEVPKGVNLHHHFSYNPINQNYWAPPPQNLVYGGQPNYPLIYLVQPPPMNVQPLITHQPNLLAQPMQGIMGIETAEHWRQQLNNVICPKLVVSPIQQQQYGPANYQVPSPYNPNTNYVKLYVNMYQKNKELINEFDRERLTKNQMLIQLMMLERAMLQGQEYGDSYSSLSSEMSEQQLGQGKSGSEETNQPNFVMPQMVKSLSGNMGERYISGRKKHLRRCANEIEKSYQCPYPQCAKHYGSEGSLNLHLRLKHNAGSKTEREKTAKQLVMALQTGQNLPVQKLKRINLPPGTIEKVAQELTLEAQLAQRLHSKSSQEAFRLRNSQQQVMPSAIVRGGEQRDSDTTEILRVPPNNQPVMQDQQGSTK